MCLQVVEIGGREPATLQRRTHEVALGLGVGDAVTGARAAVVDGGRLDHGEDSVAVGAGRVQTLEQNGARALGGHVPGAALAEAAAASVLGEEAALGELKQLHRVAGDVDPAGHRDVAVTVANGEAGLVDGDQ